VTGTTDPLQSFGQSIETRLAADLGAAPTRRFADVAEVRNLGGQVTGFVRAWDGPRLDRAASLSVTIAPGLRYFNIHVIPDVAYDVPRFLFEGMLMPQGSQVSIDLYLDLDLGMHLDYLGTLAGIEAIYKEARRDSPYPLEPSRLAHMRAICSPYFFLVNKVPQDGLALIERYANRYFDEWLKMFRAGRRLTVAESADRLARRNYAGESVIALDPDRHMIVQVYGEETTCAIERAMILC
jgi:hypothetical protein